MRQEGVGDAWPEWTTPDGPTSLGEYIIHKDRHTKWRRTKTLSHRHHLPTQSLGELGGENDEDTGPDDKTVRTLVEEAQHQRWRDVMSRKSDSTKKE